MEKVKREIPEEVYDCKGFSNMLFYTAARDLMLMNSVELEPYD